MCFLCYFLQQKYLHSTCIHFSDEQFPWKVNDDYLLLTDIPSLAKRGDGVH